VANPISIILLASDCFGLLLLLLLVEELAFDNVVAGVEDDVVADVVFEFDSDDDDCGTDEGVLDKFEDEGVVNDGLVLVTVSFKPPPELPCFMAN
jgi:hypothetical protein